MSKIFQSKFAKTLKTLTKTELKAFDSWLKSPWCNTNKNLIRLLCVFEKYHPVFEGRKLNKAKLFQQVLPNGKYSDRRMNNLLSEAYLAAEQFLIFQELKANKTLQQDLLTQAQQRHHLDTWFFKTSSKAVATVESKVVKDWEDHLLLLRLHRRVYQHPNQQLRAQFGNKSLVEKDKQLDLVYLLEKAVIINEKMARNRILKDESHEVEADLSLWLKASEGVQEPAIELYQKRFQYEEATMLEQYFELRMTFLEQYELLSVWQQKIHLFSLLNDTALLIQKTLIDITENLPLYEFGLRTGIIFNNEKLSYNTYVRIISTSNYKGSFDFSKNIIDTHTVKLEDIHQLDGMTWANAHTSYWKKELEKCLDILQDHTFKLPYFQLITRVLITQTVFDLNLKDRSYQDYLFNFLNAFERWLLRDEIWSKFNKISFLRFIQKTRSLTKIYAKNELKLIEVERIFEDITNVQAINWLIDKKIEILKIKNPELNKMSSGSN